MALSSCSKCGRIVGGARLERQNGLCDQCYEKGGPPSRGIFGATFGCRIRKSGFMPGEDQIEHHLRSPLVGAVARVGGSLISFSLMDRWGKVQGHLEVPLPQVKSITQRRLGAGKQVPWAVLRSVGIAVSLGLFALAIGVGMLWDRIEKREYGFVATVGGITAGGFAVLGFLLSLPFCLLGIKRGLVEFTLCWEDKAVVFLVPKATVRNVLDALRSGGIAERLISCEGES